MQNKKGKIALLFTTRNCYQLFDNIFFKYTTQDFSDYHIFNIDLNSNKDQLKIASDVFSKHNITNIETNGDDENIYSIERDIEICTDYIKEHNLDIDWVIWCSHDGCLEGDDFMNRFESILDDNPEFKTEVGVIGFADYGTIEINKPCYGRGCLVKGLDEMGNGWYQNLPKEYEESEYFIVEGIHDNYCAVNIDLYDKYKISDYNFILFFVWDDISAHFGLHNIASITIPSLCCVDYYREKPKYGLKRSLNAGTDTHIDRYSKKTWHNFWKKKYGWTRGRGGNRPSKLPEMFKKHSIQHQLYNSNIEDGPKQLKDLE